MGAILQEVVVLFLQALGLGAGEVSFPRQPGPHATRQRHCSTAHCAAELQPRVAPKHVGWGCSFRRQQEGRKQEWKQPLKNALCLQVFKWCPACLLYGQKRLFYDSPGQLVQPCPELAVKFRDRWWELMLAVCCVSETGQARTAWGEKRTPVSNELLIFAKSLAMLFFYWSFIFTSCFTHRWKTWIKYVTWATGLI